MPVVAAAVEVVIGGGGRGAGQGIFGIILGF